MRNFLFYAVIAVMSIATVVVVVKLKGDAGHHGAHLDHANIDVSDTASLQRGAKYFVNYCLGCHSAEYLRYSHISRDLDISEEQVKENLMFTALKLGETMQSAMDPVDAKEWFGVIPPDLSLVARSRGVDWLYTYLRTFYVDETRVPIGVNNLVFPGVGMPHVLWDLQGVQKAVFKETEVTLSDGSTKIQKKFDKFEIIEPGLMTPKEYDTAVRDLVNFLAYTGEPASRVRGTVGTKVILFLIVFGILAYFLKKEYWRDIH